MQLDLNGKVILVTGAGAGIGAACVLLASARGAAVAVCAGQLLQVGEGGGDGGARIAQVGTQPEVDDRLGHEASEAPAAGPAPSPAGLRLRRRRVLAGSEGVVASDSPAGTL